MRPRGFTLVEAVVAFLVLFVAVTVSFSVISSVKRASNLNERHFSGALIGHSILNEVRTLSFASVTNRSGTITRPDTRAGTVSTEQYTYNVDVENLTTDTKRVRATVRWTGKDGQKQVILQTLVVDI